MSIHTYDESLKTTAVFHEVIVSGICVIAAGDKRKLKKARKAFHTNTGYAVWAKVCRHLSLLLKCGSALEMTCIENIILWQQLVFLLAGLTYRPVYIHKNLVFYSGIQ